MPIASDIKLKIGESETALQHIADKRLHGKAGYLKILKKSLDARDKNNIRWVYTIEYDKTPPVKTAPPLERASKQPKRVLIVGSGPAGLFCAVRLIDRGIRPLLIERGAPVEERQKDVDAFFTTRLLNTESNVQFGEGGAGTFSDGKLNTQTNGAYNRFVLETFVRFGAPEEILYASKPHIGSDRLSLIVKKMRDYVLREGGEVCFHTKLSDIRVKDGAAAEAVLSDGRALPVSELVLALGHSARDTFAMLYERGVAFEQKEFAVGLRIEHLQSMIGFSQYGGQYPLLPPADYKLVSHAGERAAFTFCMCPGGFVMPAASEQGGVVVNGMSLSRRDGVNANAALVAQVKKEDFANSHPLAGIAYQRELERAAFRLGGGDYRAPVQLVGDFLAGKESSRFGDVSPTYAAGTSFADLNTLLPPVIGSSLKAALPDMDRRLKGFASPDAVLSGVESRTSSPVRMTRNESGESVSLQGVYPVGEGAGYSGGITSSAADGLKAADRIAEKYL